MILGAEYNLHFCLPANWPELQHVAVFVLDVQPELLKKVGHLEQREVVTTLLLYHHFLLAALKETEARLNAKIIVL